MIAVGVVTAWGIVLLVWTATKWCQRLQNGEGSIHCGSTQLRSTVGGSTYLIVQLSGWFL